MESQTAAQLRIMLYGHNDAQDPIPESLMKMNNEAVALLRMFGGATRLEPSALAMLVLTWRRFHPLEGDNPSKPLSVSEKPTESRPKKNPLAEKLIPASV